MDEDKDYLRAKDYAYKLLSYRQRSSREMAQRLRKKGVSAQAIRKTIEYLSELDYLNDENFAKFWVQSKIQAKPLGWSLLRYQLRQKGVAEEILERVFSEYALQYDEYEAARKLVSLRRSRHKHLNPLKLKRRLSDYLRRRGFSPETILEAIK